MTDKQAELLDIARQAIDEASGNAAKAKLILSRMIRSKKDLLLERALYAPYHDPAIDTALSAGYKFLRATGKYTKPHGTRPTAAASSANGASTVGESTFPQAARFDEPVGQAHSFDGFATAFNGNTDLGLQQAEAAPAKPFVPTINIDALDLKMHAKMVCALDLVRVNGRALRHCSVLEVRESADRDHNMARFKFSCINGMQDDMTVGDHLTDNEANEYYRDAGFRLPD